MPRLLKSLIQSDFHDGVHGNFEAVIVEGESLVHWFRSNLDAGFVWKRGQVIVPSGVAGPGSIIQSDFKTGSHGNFEVVVPLKASNGALELWHFFHDNSNVALPWGRGQRIAANVAGPGCIIQSDMGSTSHGNFEVVVPVHNGSGMDLVHFFHDNSNVALPWTQGQRIAANVAGPGCIIQSDFKTGSHGNFEVVVPLPAIGVGGQELWHFFHDNSNVALPWQRGQSIAQFTTGPGSLIQSDFKTGAHGNFEVLVPIGKSLVHFFHDNSNVALPWGRGEIVTDVATGWASMMRSDYIAANHGNFEVLVEEGTQSIVSYYHPNQNVAFPWMRVGPVIGEPYPARATLATRKVCQLTGEYDREGWNGINSPPFAMNRTESRFTIRGCDLGSSFEHNGRAYFLFGDTFRTTEPPNRSSGLDSIAFTTDTDPSQGVHLTFYVEPPLVPGIDQSGFNVPLDGVSHGGAMYVFFSTGHYNIDGHDLMGSSVLARSADEGQNYTKLGVFSSNKFINVSIEPGVLDQAGASALNMAVGTQVLWIFGSGRYRASAVYLAVIPLAGLPNLGPVLYLNADGKWRSVENDAAPLVPEGDVGELSARWNPFLGRWLLLFNSGNPGGILMHSAPHAWGPWTPAPVMVFDPGKRSNPNDECSGAGYGSFMHISWKEKHCDHVQDDMWMPGTFRDDEWAGEYGPYQITRYATGAAGQSSQIWFTMSTWNPYQSMLMTTEITANLL